jgi:predicted nucleic acid-binding Zn ribbon protein
VRARSKRDPVRLGGAIRRVLDELGHHQSSAAMRIVACWEEAVGSEIAGHCQPSALRGKVLEVTVESSVWNQHLQMRRDEILDGLRAALGAEAPSDLHFRVG